MRKLKNTLYITTPGTYVSREGECLVIRFEDDRFIRVPAHNLEGLVYFGYPGISPQALSLCAELGISVSFLRPNGRFLARVEGPQSGNILLRRKQYRICDNEAESAKLASRFIAGKIYNCRVLIRRGIRDHGPNISASMENWSVQLKRLLLKCFDSNNLDILRGIEGEAARYYFSGLDELILEDKDNFFMKKRSRRPPLDRFNCLISFLYTLLVHECRSACETVGLDPAAGFLHRDRPGRPSLALDLMEELRPVIADRLALTLINRKQITAKDFCLRPNGVVEITDEARKIVIDAWQSRKQDTLMHPFIKEKIQYGLIPYVQAMLLSRYMRGDLEDYPAFTWR